MPVGVPKVPFLIPKKNNDKDEDKDEDIDKEEEVSWLDL